MIEEKTEVPNRKGIRSDLDALRLKHGAKSPIGHRCSNIAELLKLPEMPTDLIRRQMDDLQRLLAAR
jgi:hypothetical protein